MGCPFDPAQGEESPLYVNPVNVLNILTKVSRLVAGGRNREGPSDGVCASFVRPIR